MRNIVSSELEAGRIRTGTLATPSSYGLVGAFKLKRLLSWIVVISTDGTGGSDGAEKWEHVSVHAIEHNKSRIPTWDEMCYVKNLFWADDETVVQFHPRKSEYVNKHPFTLHLWRHKTNEFVLPPEFCV